MSGYMHDFYADIDECEMSPCDEISNTLCINTNGSYYCGCQPGYSRIGVFCTGTDNYKLCSILYIFIILYIIINL